MIIYWKEHLSRHKGDVFNFAYLYSAREDIESYILQQKKDMDNKSLNAIKTLAIASVKRMEQYKSEIDEYKSRKDLSYGDKLKESEVVESVLEFLRSNGPDSIFDISIYTPAMSLKRIESEDLKLDIDEVYDENGREYYGTDLTFSTVSNNRYYKEESLRIRLNEGDIVFNKDNFILMTSEYDLVLEVKNYR